MRDYFLEQWERFKDMPGGILAHSTHVKGHGQLRRGDAASRRRASGHAGDGHPGGALPPVNLGYADYRAIDPAWEGREAEGILLVPHAGEVLYRLRGQ